MSETEIERNRILAIIDDEIDAMSAQREELITDHRLGGRKIYDDKLRRGLSRERQVIIETLMSLRDAVAVVG